jgi:hypothetical protein
VKKTINLFLLILFLLNASNGLTQKTGMEQKVENLISLGKDSIIQIALSLVDEDVKIENFSKIMVVTNGSLVYVSFMNPIKYLPMGSVFYFDVGVNVLDKTINYSPTSNTQLETNAKIPFYIETPESLKHIQFVIEAINKSGEIGSVNIETFQDNMTIREHKNYYEIIVVSETTESSYKIEKISGKVYDAIHAHLEQVPIEREENAPFIEIK